MPLDLAAITPVPGKGMAPRVVQRERKEPQPNPFLDNGWLKQSYETGTDYQVTVPGSWEQSEIKKGPRKGEQTERLVGDAAEVTRMLREAANRLGIGVAIQYETPTTKAGKEIAGKVTVHYIGKRRKENRKAQVSTVTTGSAVTTGSTDPVKPAPTS